MKGPTITLLIFAFGLLLAGPLIAQQEPNPSYISLYGAFTKPGKIAYSKGMQLTQAVRVVGGVASNAKLNGGVIFRHPDNDPSHTSALTYNWRDIAQGRAKDICLQPDDIIFMEPKSPFRPVDWPLPWIASYLNLLSRSIPQQKPNPPFVSVAVVRGMDGITLQHIHWLLHAHHIDSYSEGSIGYGIFVPAKDQKQAIRLLKADAQQRHYVIAIPSEHFRQFGPSEKECKERRLNILYSQLLHQPDYQASTPFGSVLRHQEIKRAALQCPYVTSIQFLPRPYLDSDGKEHVGYQVVVHMAASLHKPDPSSPDFHANFQVWRGGKEVEFMGSYGYE